MNDECLLTHLPTKDFDLRRQMQFEIDPPATKVFWSLFILGYLIYVEWFIVYLFTQVFHTRFGDTKRPLFTYRYCFLRRQSPVANRTSSIEKGISTVQSYIINDDDDDFR